MRRSCVLLRLALLVIGPALLSGCSASMLRQPAALLMRPNIRHYDLERSRLQAIVRQVLTNKPIGLSIRADTPSRIESHPEMYLGQYHGWWLWRKQWEERSEYAFDIGEGRAGELTSNFEARSHTVERRGPGHSWREPRESSHADSRLHQIMNLIDERVHGYLENRQDGSEQSTGDH